jgi:hypothetical protein
MGNRLDGLAAVGAVAASIEVQRVTREQERGCLAYCYAADLSRNVKFRCTNCEPAYDANGVPHAEFRSAL